MMKIKRSFSQMFGPVSLEPNKKPQPQQPLRTTVMENQRSPQTSLRGSMNERQQFFARYTRQQSSVNAPSGRNRPRSNRGVPGAQAISRREDVDLQRAIKLSLESYEAEKSRRELDLAIEISKASPKVADEMIRLAAAGDLTPADAKDLRLALKRSMAPLIASDACTKAFRTISKGFKEYENKSRVVPHVSVKTDESAKKSKHVQSRNYLRTTGGNPKSEHDGSQEINYRSIDVLHSAMAKGNRRFRDWAESNDLRIATNTGHGNNCALLSLMQHASGNYHADYREMAQEIKAELAEKFPGEVEGTNAMLGASMDRQSFRYALQKINEKFHVNMDVYVIQAGYNGLPVMAEPRNPAPGKTPVVLWNSGSHFEAVVHKSAIGTQSMRP